MGTYIEQDLGPYMHVRFTKKTLGLSITDSILTNTVRNVVLTPWIEHPLQTYEMSLQRSKNKYSTESLHKMTTAFIQDIESKSDNNVIYYTDGSLDPDTGLAGAAYYKATIPIDKVAIRVTNHVSTLQTELAAIHLALQDANSGE